MVDKVAPAAPAPIKVAPAAPDAKTPAAQPKKQPVADAGAEAKDAKFFAGGVTGFGALTDPSSSKEFRQMGGGLYIHGVPWWQWQKGPDMRKAIGNFTQAPEPDDKKTIANLFKDRQCVVEGEIYIRFIDETTWKGVMDDQVRMIDDVVKHGLSPGYVICTIVYSLTAVATEDKNWMDIWQMYINRCRAVQNAPKSMKIVPNLTPNFSWTDENWLRSTPLATYKPWTDAVMASDGICFDAPPSWFFKYRANTPYQDWMIDAIKWVHKQQKKVVFILSPMADDLGKKDWESPQEFYQSVVNIDKLFKSSGAPIDCYVIENYHVTSAPDYPHVVGSESTEGTIMNHAVKLIKSKVIGT